MTIKSALFLVLWVATIATGITLGTWQIHRLAWKQEWLTRIDQAYQNDVPTSLPPNVTLPCHRDRTFFMRLRTPVTFTAAQSFIIQPRVNDGMFGGHLFQSTELKPGLKLWINRGFVPLTPKINPASGQQHVILQLRATDIDPAVVMKQNPQMALDALRTTPGCDALAVIGVIEQTNVKSPWPLAVGDKPNPPNDHLAYAIFWFTMSAVAFIFGIIILSKRKKPLDI